MHKTSSAPQHAFSSALLLVRHDDHAVVDRQSLRGMRFRAIRVLTSGVEAARILCGRQRLADALPFPDLVLCDEQLADMTGLDFLSLLRSHPRLASFPVIMTMNRDTPAVRRTLEDQAASGVLFRPYSGDAFLNQLTRAAAMHPPQGDPAFWRATEAETNAFDLALSRLALARKVSDQAAGQWYREGLLCLKQEQWESAAVAFQQALKDQAGHVDAARGLTLALRKRQEQAEASGRKRLSKEQADTLREELTRAAQSPNPEQAIKRVIAALDETEPAPALESGAFPRQERVELDLFEESVPEEAPATSGNAAQRNARAGSPEDPSEDPAETPSRLAVAPAPGSGSADASARQAKSSGIALLPEIPEPNSSGLIGHFPLLRDAVNVVKMTRRLYKIRKR